VYRTAYFLDATAAVLAYRDDSRRVNTHEELARLARRAVDGTPGVDAAAGLLIEIGIAEAGLTDAVSPERDGLDPLALAVRDLSVAAARAWLACTRDESSTAAEIVSGLDRLRQRPLPSSITLRVPEGFAYSALFPETYVRAASACRAALRPARVAVIGLRSIGTTLSAVVAAVLADAGVPVWSCTVRPRGHPFARQTRFDTALASRLRSEADAGACFLVVDEGPGLSGSSFASAAAALLALGVAADRIVLLPAWDTPVDRLNSETARRAWQSHRRFCADAASIGITPQRLFGLPNAVDWSAGRWRERLYRSRGEWPDVAPHYERWKVHAPAQKRVIRFAGLGPFGAAARQRAEALAANALGPSPGALRNGFLDLPYIDGTPWTAASDPCAPEIVGAYVARNAALFPCGHPVDADSLIELVACNIGELDNRAAALLPAALHAVRPLLAETAAAAIDGRMLPHEWIATTAAPVKVDALDHHRDHFFPGPQSPVWDLAGAAIEFTWSPGQIERMLRAFARAGGGRAAHRLLPFYSIAYASFRAAQASFAGMPAGRTRYSQCALNAAVSFNASSKLPRKQMARSSMNT
jgi:hypothetical protein